MKHYPNTEQNDLEEIKRFISEMKMAHLQTSIDGSFENLETGVFNPIFLNDKFYLHLNRTDDQYKALKTFPKATLTFFDFLCNIPSYWIDEEDGGVATSYYRHLDIKCDVKIIEEKVEMINFLPLFLKVYQQEGGYKEITMSEEMYNSDFKILGIVELTPSKMISKWKLGQNRPIEKRVEICSKLAARNNENDLRTIFEIERWIERYNK